MYFTPPTAKNLEMERENKKLHPMSLSEMCAPPYLLNRLDGGQYLCPIGWGSLSLETIKNLYKELENVQMRSK